MDSGWCKPKDKYKWIFWTFPAFYQHMHICSELHILIYQQTLFTNIIVYNTSTPSVATSCPFQKIKFQDKPIWKSLVPWPKWSFWGETQIQIGKSIVICHLQDLDRVGLSSWVWFLALSASLSATCHHAFQDSPGMTVVSHLKNNVLISGKCQIRFKRSLGTYIGSFVHQTDD